MKEYTEWGETEGHAWISKTQYLAETPLLLGNMIHFHVNNKIFLKHLKFKKGITLKLINLSLHV